jgi:hypothetical protein
VLHAHALGCAADVFNAMIARLAFDDQIGACPSTPDRVEE